MGEKQEETTSIINTGGGASVNGDVNTGGGNFSGRDTFIIEKPTITVIPPSRPKYAKILVVLGGMHFILVDEEKGEYLAETPISEAEWSRVMNDSPQDAVEKSGDSLAKVHISGIDIKNFLQQANKQLESDLKLHNLNGTLCIPSYRLLEKLMQFKNSNSILPRGQEKPYLRKTAPGPYGLHDLLGVVYQYCIAEDEKYLLVGGSYKSSDGEFFLESAPRKEYNVNERKSNEWGFRPLFRLSGH